MGAYSNYDIENGLALVGLYFTVFVLFLLIVFSPRLYKKLLKQDASLISGEPLDIRSEIINLLKAIILWVIGYRGEERENVNVDEVDLAWFSKFKASFFFRLLPVYAFYILSLVVLTRPVITDGSIYQIIKYSENLHELFVLLIAYVVSNVVFDLLSLRYTLSHVMQAKSTGKYIRFFLKDLFVATILFLLSQVVSCILWVGKRETSGIEFLDGNLLQNFTEITLWPYAFVSGHGASEIVSGLFPGQLLITGTVFFPTVILAVIFVIFSLFLIVTRAVKHFLLSKQLDRICRLFLKVRLGGMFQKANVSSQFGYCNYAFMMLLNTAFTAAILAIVTRLVGVS